MVCVRNCLVNFLEDETERHHQTGNREHRGVQVTQQSRVGFIIFHGVIMTKQISRNETELAYSSQGCACLTLSLQCLVVNTRWPHLTSGINVSGYYS